MLYDTVKIKQPIIVCNDELIIQDPDVRVAPRV